MEQDLNTAAQQMARVHARQVRTGDAVATYLLTAAACAAMAAVLWLFPACGDAALCLGGAAVRLSPMRRAWLRLQAWYYTVRARAVRDDLDGLLHAQHALPEVIEDHRQWLDAFQARVLRLRLEAGDTVERVAADLQR